MSAQKHVDDLCINTLRTLAMDGVQKANSGHPGAPMGMAPMAYTLWTRFLKHNPANPKWPNRDRFILSAGHASMLIYSLLHLTGYDLPLKELQQFRQWGSKTPGHPEYGYTPGVEVTTGPLGQGFSTAVGMAIAERMMAARFNKPDYDIVDHYTYVFAGDGDLMEGVSSEAASLAGHLQLGKLICLYDDNSITIEGNTKLAFTENVAKRFEAYSWHVRRIENGNDVGVLTTAIEAAQRETSRPSLICVKTHIAHGSPNMQDSHDAHGAPLGEEEIRLTKKNLGWPEDKHFYIPDDALQEFRKCVPAGAEAEQAWKDQLAAYAKAFPELSELWEQVQSEELPEGWESALPEFPADSAVATRSASGKVLNAIADAVPALVGGSADLAPSNKTNLDNYDSVLPNDFSGRNLHFGVREHAMGAMLNGLALYGGFIPYGGTFLVFCDYVRPAIRLAALMGLRVVYAFTHDSIGVGEDGPTHQPIEHLASLRSIPNLTVIRPAEATETAAAWKVALENTGGPTALALTRQNLPTIDRSTSPSADLVAKGAYILSDADGTPDVILIASGSEVGLALEAQAELTKKGIAARVVSMPSWEMFDKQPQAYRDEVLPPAVTARLAIEMGIAQGWQKYTGFQGDVLSIERFGASGPAQIVIEQYGFTIANVVERASKLVQAKPAEKPKAAPTTKAKAKSDEESDAKPSTSTAPKAKK
jgi:transketolase